MSARSSSLKSCSPWRDKWGSRLPSAHFFCTPLDTISQDNCVPLDTTLSGCGPGKRYSGSVTN
jgi:hypothetical protein